MKKIYDNTNLAESYAGIVLPLTTSFANDVYDGVYRNFASFMGISKKKQKENEHIFPKMVVTIGYRMYYDLFNWYTLISMLPGYTYNKDFFEQMLGVSKSVKTSTEVNEKSTVFYRRVFEMLGLYLRVIKILFIFITMPIWIIVFNKKFDNTYDRFISMDLDAMSHLELCAHYKTVRKKLVKLWKIPIANDFAVMVSVGISKKMYEKWLPDDDFANSLRLASTASIATLDPGKELFKILSAIKENKKISDLFYSDKVSLDIYTELVDNYADSKPVLLIDKYIKTLGGRVPNELKLETNTLAENPESIIDLLMSVDSVETKLFTERVKINRDVNSTAKKINAGSLVKNLLLKMVLSWARKSIQYREETRMRRTQIFGHARSVFLSIGDRFSSLNKEFAKDDVMYLTTKEICLNKNIDIVDIVKKRKKNIETWSKISIPSRIETDTESLHKLEKEITEGYRVEIKESDKKQKEPVGIVASTANIKTISGTTVVLKEFDKHADYTDKILVTKHTDPGWVVIFPLVRAIIVERGGILSHASIVAREMNIPCIIGVEDATDTIKNNTDVTLDLISGKIFQNDK